MGLTHVLYESASGYGLFEVDQAEKVGTKLAEVQATISDLAKFGKYVKAKSFAPFKNAADALENINDVSEGQCSDSLKAFLELNLPKGSKSILGVSDKNLAGSIKAEASVQCSADELAQELIRGIRLHAEKLISQLKTGDLAKAQLGLGHAYSRAKVKFNVNKSDNMIIQAISLLDQLDKDLNTFSMRVREWYGWHFPELAKIVADHYRYARLAKAIKNKATLGDDSLEMLTEITEDDSVSQQIVDAARASMGTDISEIDLLNIETFAARVISLAEYRKNLYDYLLSKMNLVAPNLAALIGDIVGARLIAHAGSLTNLSKYPASTVQILGAEKALFRALKTRGNTPKYGLIYNSTFIGRAGTKNKGRISRFLANKATIASRIDCYSDAPTTKFGEALRQQVEDRLNFYETGAQPSKNSETMEKVIKSLADAADDDMEEDVKPKASKKRSSTDDIEKVEKKKEKKEKKDKSAEKESKKDKKEKSDKKDKKKK
ncbi:Nucleolar protein 56 [Coemansia sp. RSA 922]|nr:Nucleolar protein 56 [Coemansia sp. S680]KAJ2041688.1 Nucleolar protein 56 [Coemansia sp. S3946]KAJ2048880.1 Nucleolar protein 56 [Coemansia sp. S16]KAJ2073464.1 Nucleolar protein 56 [Coemansia sp. S155-1]KAJ2115032.1 Nucleolar protein 56 [Coemansia sp. RSA 922]